MANGVLYPRSKEEVDEMIASLHRGTAKLLKSKKKAREFMIKNGFMTKDGKLTKRYGG
ncbi:MAG TPA: hypothetical protein VGO11_19135 [Chthoniobacteraceae bacterium]|nr:hypothetical protein [Chthoniobacteraceae bacterium]